MSYQKSLSADFPSGLNANQLKNQINESSISEECIMILNVGDTVTIKFSRGLTTDEESILDQVVSGHVPVTTMHSDNVYTINPTNPQINHSSYSLVSRFEFVGSDSNDVNAIRVVSKMDSDVTSYDIRVVNMCDMTIVSEKTGMVNTEPEVIDLGDVNNLPSECSIFEIYAKRTGGTSNKTGVKIDQITIHLE